MRILYYTLLLTTLTLPLKLLAQHKWETALFVGGANYQGDIVPTVHPYPKETNLAAGLIGRYLLHKEWALRMGLTYAQLSGTDQNFTDEDFTKNRQFSFQSHIFESAVLLEWEPFANRRYPAFNQFKGLISPYVFVGGGVVLSDLTTVFALYQNGEAPIEIQQDKAIKNPGTHFSIPMGGGIKFDLSKRLALGLEAGTRYTFTDYIDGVSKAANPGKGDWYVFGGLSLNIRFYAKDADADGIPDKEDRCPKLPGHITAKGCPDQDGDGVEDVEDLCPTESGIKILGGCPDTDNDGIADKDDVCPQSPGPENTGGCPDFDADGIADKDDQCPKLAGDSYKCGCPLMDTDGDGIIDEKPFCEEPVELVLLKKIEPHIAAAAQLVKLQYQLRVLPGRPLWQPIGDAK